MPLPVITVAQMREWEKATWANGQTEENVIRLAGAAVARKAEQLTKPGDFILILSGKGNNGEDARVAAEAIHDREVKLLRVIDPKVTSAELAPLLTRKPGPPGAPASKPVPLGGPASPPALIIDGLFGIGLNRALGLDWIKLIQEINQSGRPILAVDVPSGLNADTGFPLEESIRATCTLTMGAAKRGLLSSAAWPFVGRLEAAAEIGLIPYPFTTELRMILADDFIGFPPPRPLDAHKGTFGHVGIIAGSFGYHGAAVLAARGAQRAQPGLITVVTEEKVYHPVAEQLQSAMVQTFPGAPPSPSLPPALHSEGWGGAGGRGELPRTCTAVVIGPGLASDELSPAIPEAARRLWRESPLAVIVDASALEWLPEGACPDNALRVITPHPGEAARLLQSTSTEVQNNRGKTLRELSRRWGNCFVVLKGHQTMIGRAREDLFVNCSGNPHLAQGGSGDLLAGYLGGLLAQPALQKDAAKTIQYAVWQHGAAADELSAQRPNWTVEDLANVLGSVTP